MVVVSPSHQSPRKQYTGDGVTTNFAFPHRVLADSDLIVLIDATQAASGYSIEGIGDLLGCEVIFSTPPANGSALTLYRDTPRERLSDFLEGQYFKASSLNRDLDTLTLIVQELDTKSDTALRASMEDGYASLILPPLETRKNKVLYFDANGAPEAVVYPDTDVMAEITANRQAAEASKDLSEAARLKAQQWAANPQDTAVESGQFSALHWASHAKDWASAPKDVEIEVGAYSSRHHAIKSKSWAQESEDTSVEPGLYSAFHWAKKAEASAITAASFDPDAYYTKSQSDGQYPNYASLISISSANSFDSFVMIDEITATFRKIRKSDLLPPNVTQSEAEEGTLASERLWSPYRVKQAISAQTNVKGTAKAWVTYSTNPSSVIVNAYNFSSITNNGTGRDSLNLSLAMSTSDYPLVATTSQDSVPITVARDTTFSTTTLRVSLSTKDYSALSVRRDSIYLAVFGDLA